MRLLLYIPAFIDVTAPLLSVPSLVAYLKKNGYDDIVVKDLNVEFMHFLQESDYLETQAKTVIQDFENLNALKELTPEETPEFNRLYNLYIFCKLQIYKKLGEYLDILRDKEQFYDVCRYTVTVHGFFQHCFNLINYKNALGLDYLFVARVMERIPDDDRIFTQFYKERILPQIDQIQPQVIGFSVCYSDQFHSSVYLAEMIKERYPQIHIVMGGTHFNVLKDDFLVCKPEYFRFADSYIVGEGEIPLLALLKELENGKHLEKVPNLIYMQADTIMVNDAFDGLPIQELPSPDFSCVSLDEYLAPHHVLPYRIARGCYWNKCAFCVHFQTKHFSYKDARLVVDDIAALSRQYRTHFFYFVDDSLPKAFLDNFMDIIETEGIEIYWVGNIRCDKFMTPSFIAKLAKSGCRELYLGIESGSQRILDLVKKGIDLNLVEQIIHECHKHSIAIKMNYISGLPHEDQTDIETTVNFIKRTAKNSDIIALTPLGIGKGTDIGENPSHYGVELLEKKDKRRIFLNFKRTRGLLDFDQIERLYKEHSIIFNRFSFFNRVHHFLYTLHLPRKDFEELASRLYMVSDRIHYYFMRDSQDFQLEMNKIPIFCNNHHPEMFNFNLKDIQNPTNGKIPAKQTLYLYSFLNFEILTDISVFTYQLLTLCDGKNNAGKIIDYFKSKFPTIDPKTLENQAAANFNLLYKNKVIDFI